MKIDIDLSVCQGYANCIMEAEDIFDLDEETGLAVLVMTEVPEERLAEVQRAAASCPVRAIRVQAAE